MLSHDAFALSHRRAASGGDGEVFAPSLASLARQPSPKLGRKRWHVTRCLA